MHRRDLLEKLSAYRPWDDAETMCQNRIIEFVRNHTDCFQRSLAIGHITGSAWLLDHAGARVLLTHHRKLGKWLQLGGHADGDPDPARAALREAREESGLLDLELAGPGEPLDVDVHVIPAGVEPAHLHHDLRYLVIARAGQALRCSAESHELRWFPVESAERVLREESLLRMARRAQRLLSTSPLK
jgi:8-oxo-dGTP pyrophosphatase MutT (NUDIX family)